MVGQFGCATGGEGLPVSHDLRLLTHNPVNERYGDLFANEPFWYSPTTLPFIDLPTLPP